MSLMAISKELGIPLSQVLAEDKPAVALFTETKVTKAITVKESESEEDSLKTSLKSAAVAAVQAITTSLKDADAGEISKLSDSIAKMHTALFKTDPGTVINIQANQLSQFRSVLKD